MRSSRWALAAGLLPVCLFVAPFARADEVIFWNQQALQAIRNTSLNPPMASRALAIAHAAMYDAVNAIEGTHRPYLYQSSADPTCSKEAAVAQAAYTTLSALFPTQAANLQTQLTARLAMIPDGAPKALGIGLGQTVGDGMLAARSNDGSAFNPGPYTGGNAIGQWRPTPPGFANGLLPAWGQVTPFALTSSSQFHQGPPPQVSSAEYTTAYNEVKELGALNSATRTEDQTNIARFWADGAGTSTPPGHWNRIAADVGTARNNTLHQNARMFALLNFGVADSAIACWDMKYLYEYWRPVTGIREGDNDGNPDTVGDANWSSLIVNPPFPAYTSGHSTFSGSSAVILARFFGTDAISFSSNAEGFAVPDRNFNSFSQAALEAMDSRLYGGIHWRFDNEVGLVMGRDIGGYVYDNYLGLVPEPASLAVLGLGVLPLLWRRCRSR